MEEWLNDERQRIAGWYCHLPRRVWVGQQIIQLMGMQCNLVRSRYGLRPRPGPATDTWHPRFRFMKSIACQCHLLEKNSPVIWYVQLFRKFTFRSFWGARRTTCICSFIKLISLRPSQRCQPVTVTLLYWKACCCLVYQGIAMSSVWVVEHCQVELTSDIHGNNFNMAKGLETTRISFNTRRCIQLGQSESLWDTWSDQEM